MKRGNKRLLVVGDRVLVRPEKSEGMTKVGLYLPPGVVEKEEVRGGVVVAIGPGQPLPVAGANPGSCGCRACRAARSSWTGRSRARAG